MRGLAATTLAFLVAASVAAPLRATAAEADLQQKVDSLSRELDALKKQVAQGKEGKAAGKGIGDWLTVGGDYRFRIDSLRGEVPAFFDFLDPAFQEWLGGGMAGPPPAPAQGFKVKNDAIYTNRFGLNLKAKATKNVTVTARLLMYKTFGSQDDSAVSGLQINGAVRPFFADRVGVFDGTVGHVPADGKIAVDQAYATWTNILDAPVWFSVGRRPSTGGIPTHLRQNNEKPGNAGIPGLLVDYAFDGMTLGVAPDIEALPGAYAKVCYGRGFENGITATGGNGLTDMDMIGVSVVPYDTDPLYVNLQWTRGMNIFDFPVINSNTVFGSTKPRVNLGDIDTYGITVLGAVKNVGPGTLNLFASAAVSKTHPGDATVPGMPFPVGLLYSFPDAKEGKTGNAVYAGARYDVSRTRTKLGFEYNRGSKNWITFVPAGDDMWTSKLGTRGNVYEGYVIQEFRYEPISSYVSKSFVRLGYQYYDFDYTGSNNWVGSPVKIADLASNPAFAQMLIPLEKAHDLYATLEVKF